MATIISSTLQSPFLYAFLLLLLCSVKKEHSVEAKKSGGDFPQTHTLEVSSLLAADVCSHSPSAFDQGSSLRVVPSYGPCNHQNQEKGAKVPSYAEMLLQDKLRVQSLQAKARLFKKNRGTGVSSEMKASVPAHSGTALGMGTGNYVVTLGLGTPAKQLTFLIDASNDLTWTQCEPCVTSCYQKDPRFDPAKSSSYKNVSCKSPLCGLIDGKSCSGSTCHYEYQYSYKYMSGFLATETLTIEKSEVFTNFLFGCGQKIQGPYGRASGVVSLTRSNLSLPTQTAGKYKGLFSYCLPSSSSSTGHLTLGGNIPKGTKFTPLNKAAETTAYPLDMTGVSVGGRLVPIDESFFEDAGSIIDPGTLISHLPPGVHGAMTRAFEDLMSDYPRTDGYADFQTCYDFRGYDKVTIPSISFYFKGGLEVAVHKSGIMMALPSLNKVCLAFASNLEDQNTAIFGAAQQRTYEVVYDVAKARIGFAPNGCS